MPEPRDRRRTFGPVVLLGLASAGLAAVAGHQPWAEGVTTTQADTAMLQIATRGGKGEYPLAGALALVCLATWGVVLVTRGRVRRVVAGLGVLAAVGVLVTVVLGAGSVPAELREVMDDVGVTDPEVRRTLWPWATGVGAVLAVAAGALAVRLSPAWPEMGRKYDAPTGAEEPTPEPGSLELWKQLDEGDDPTL